MAEPIHLAWSADGPAAVDETLEIDADGSARLLVVRSADPDRLDRAGRFEATPSDAARAALRAAVEAVAAASIEPPRPGALVLTVRAGDAPEVRVPAPDVDEGPAAELHRAAARIAGEVAASPASAVQLAGSIFGPASVSAGGIPRIDLVSIGRDAAECTVHLGGLRFVAEAEGGVEDWLDPAAVTETGGILSSMGRLVARDETPALLAPGARAGLAIPGGLRPSRAGRHRVHARLPLALALDGGGSPAEVELVSPWFEVDVDA